MLWRRQAIFESKGDKFSSSAESGSWAQGLRHQIVSRLKGTIICELPYTRNLSLYQVLTQLRTWVCNYTHTVCGMWLHIYATYSNFEVRAWISNNISPYMWSYISNRGQLHYLHYAVLWISATPDRYLSLSTFSWHSAAYSSVIDSLVPGRFEWCLR